MSDAMIDRDKSRELMTAANTALRRGDVPAALAALRGAAEADPHDDEPSLLAATIQLRIGAPIPAAHLAMDTLELRPFHASALNVLGVACIESMQPGLARKVLKRAVEMAPGMENAWRNLEDAERRATELREAAVPRDEVLRAAHLLPQARIRRLLAKREPTLTVAVIARTGDNDAVRGTLDSMASLGPRVTETLVVDGRAGGDPFRAPDGVEVVRVDKPAPAAHDEALWRARTDWVLIVEAGEILEAGSGATIEAAMANTGNLAHAVNVGHGTAAPRRAIRLVRNAPGVRFTGRRDPRMHASLAPLCAKWGLETGLDPVATLLATGPVVVTDETPRDELVKRLKRDVEADPTDYTARLELERLEAESGRTEEALRAVRRVKQSLAADARGATVQEIEEATVLEAWCLARLGRNEELDALVREHHARHQESPNSLFLAGVAARTAGDAPVAARRFRRALTMECPPGWSAPLPEVAGPVLPTMLGLTCIDGGEFELARAAFDTALRREPDNLEAELGRLAATYGEGEIERVLGELDRLAEAHGDDPKVWITGGILLGQFPQLAPVAVDWLEEACRRIPGNPDLLRRLGEAQLRCGRGEAALETWNALEDPDSELLPARVAACLASGGALGELASGSDAEIENGVLLWFQRWAASGSWEALDRALTGLPGACDLLPGLVESTAAWLERGGQEEAARRLRAGAGAEA